MSKVDETAEMNKANETAEIIIADNYKKRMIEAYNAKKDAIKLAEANIMQLITEFQVYTTALGMLGIYKEEPVSDDKEQGSTK